MGIGIRKYTSESRNFEVTHKGDSKSNRVYVKIENYQYENKLGVDIDTGELFDNTVCLLRRCEARSIAKIQSEDKFSDYSRQKKSLDNLHSMVHDSISRSCGDDILTLKLHSDNIYVDFGDYYVDIIIPKDDPYEHEISSLGHHEQNTPNVVSNEKEAKAYITFSRILSNMNNIRVKHTQWKNSYKQLQKFECGVDLDIISSDGFLDKIRYWFNSRPKCESDIKFPIYTSEDLYITLDVVKETTHTFSVKIVAHTPSETNIPNIKSWSEGVIFEKKYKKVFANLETVLKDIERIYKIIK